MWSLHSYLHQATSERVVPVMCSSVTCTAMQYEHTTSIHTCKYIYIYIYYLITEMCMRQQPCLHSWCVNCISAIERTSGFPRALLPVIRTTSGTMMQSELDGNFWINSSLSFDLHIPGKSSIYYLLYSFFSPALFCHICLLQFLHHSNSILWWWYDRWNEKEKPQAYNFTDSRDL